MEVGSAADMKATLIERWLDEPLAVATQWRFETVSVEVTNLFLIIYPLL